MDFIQNEKTRKFVRQVNAMLEGGIIKRKKDLVTLLHWDETMMSHVMNGRKNIPNDVFRKFTELYPPEQQDMDYKDQLLEARLQQADDLRGSLVHERTRNKSLEELTEEVSSLAQSIAEAKKNQQVMYSIQAAFQDFWLEWLSEQSGRSLSELKAIVSEKAAAYLQNSQQVGSRVS